MDPDERDEIAPHEFAQVVAGRLGLGDAETPAGFADGPAVEELEDGMTDPDTGSTQVTPDDQGRLRNPDGTFAARESDEEPEEDDETLVQGELDEPAAEEEEEPLALEVDDPEIQAFLAKYGNDPVKALKAATEAQSLLGRQGQELGELRGLAGKVDELQQLLVMQMTDPRYQAPVDWRAEIESNPAHATELAYQRGNGEAYAAALEAWMEDEPLVAATYHAGVLAEFQADQAGATAPPAEAEAASDPAVDAEVAKVVQRHPDLPSFLDKIGEVARERPYLAKALGEGEPQARAQALEDLYLLARGRDTDTLAADAAQAVTSQNQQAAAAARQGARVVSARRSTATSATPSPKDQFLAAFRARTGLPDLEVE